MGGIIFIKSKEQKNYINLMINLDSLTNLIILQFNNKSKLNTFMQFNQTAAREKSFLQLLKAPDPEQYLLEEYSSALRENKEDFCLCKMYIRLEQLRDQISKTKSQLSQLKGRFQEGVPAFTPRKTQKQPPAKGCKMDENSISNQQSHKHRRIRRNANQISRHFRCPVNNCKKQYGSEGSLNQHIKLKHQGLERNQQGGSGFRDSKGEEKEEDQRSSS